MPELGGRGRVETVEGLYKARYEVVVTKTEASQQLKTFANGQVVGIIIGIAE
jgi:hypothetical protein